MNIRSLTHSLNCLCNCLDKLYNINSGGCCYVAYLIAYHLDKLKINYNLIIYDSIKRDKNIVNQEIQNMNIPCSVIGNNTCSHYCISVSNRGIVNKGDFTGLKKCTVKNINNENIKWLYINGSWNKMYNRDDNKCVKDMINSFFSKYEKNNLSNH